MPYQPISTKFMERRMVQLSKERKTSNALDLAGNILDIHPNNINALGIVLDSSYETHLYKRGVDASKKLIKLGFHSYDIYSCGLENALAYYLYQKKTHNSNELDKTLRFMLMSSRRLVSYYDSEETRNLIVDLYLKLPSEVKNIFHSYNRDIIEQDRTPFIEMVK